MYCILAKCNYICDMETIKINVMASLNIHNDLCIHLVKMHLSDTRPKQFEDSFGNLWYASELSHFTRVDN
jgi:hypothetical protein